MKTFITDNFLLQSEFAQKLYHNYAAKQPIIDYHNHLSPQEIAKDKKFENISEVWLAGDHYKWRAMRALGVSEKYITGNASDREKFMKWAESVPYTLRNPLYHWTHLELQRYFGIEELLSADNADAGWEKTNAMLKQDSHSVNGLLQQQNVELLCTTDDPIDNLEHHQSIAGDENKPTVLPTFRPDKALDVSDVKAFKDYLLKMEEVVGFYINSYDLLLQALSDRVDYFHKRGCRLSDYGLSKIFPHEMSGMDIKVVWTKAYEGKNLTADEVAFFAGYTLLQLAKMYHAKGWTQQFHLGALRNNNKRLLKELGPDTGFDSMGDFSHAVSISNFLNELDSSDQLAKTIIYNLNPADNEMIATMVGNFNDGTIRGKVQYGAAWWFLDQKDGMEKQLNALSSLGMLSTFVGMLTDSRSFLSFPRHEYFRRVLCNLIGKDVANGELPADEKWMGKIINDICYHNAKSYFGFGE
ncbi:MAG: glucuronate isomerase [Nonlabens sp.]